MGRAFGPPLPRYMEASALDKTTIRFKTGIAGYTAPYGTPGERLFGYEPGDVAEVETGQARKWLESGTAERVELAIREPLAERAVRVVGRRRGR